MHDIGWGWEFLMVVGMVAFWVLIVVAVVWLVRGGLGTPTTGPSAPREEAPIDILRRRLASGELTVAEFEERREAIERSRGGAGAPV